MNQNEQSRRRGPMKPNKDFKFNSKETLNLFRGSNGPQARQPQIQRKKQNQRRMPELPEKVRIHSLAELHELAVRLKPGSDEEIDPIIIDTKGTPFADDLFNGYVTIPQEGGQSVVRKMLLEGFEMVKNHHQFQKISQEDLEITEDFGGHIPATPPNTEGHIMWIDLFIDRNLGGKREGLYVTWELDEGKYRMDPWTCELEKVDD